MKDARYDDHAWILIMAVVACVLSFIPFYITSNFIDNNNNNYNFMDPNLREACMASLFVVLSPAIDSIVEFLSFLPTAREADKKRQNVIDSKSIMTIIISEKSIYVVGILCLSVLYPTLQNYNMELLIHSSTSFFNCSTMLMVCAILSFLYRRSVSFVLWNTRIMVLFVCASGVINSCTFMSHQNNPSIQTDVLFLVSNIMFDVATLVYMGTCFYSLLQWYKRLYGNKRSMISDVHRGMINNGDHNNTNAEREKSKVITIDESINNFVVGTHMFSTMVVMIVNSVSIWYTPFLTLYQLTIIIYIMIGTAIIVFVTDNLAKRHVTAAALNALLDAKTDYVRYISHEIRTPLSATLMGLRLMLNDFKKSMPRPGSVDADRLDTLQDINSSCVAALDILNDLLCFNKLEAGQLELHKEMVSPGQFVKDSVAMFNVQARDCGVILKVVLHRPPSENGSRSGSVPGSVRSLLGRGARKVSALGAALLHGSQEEERESARGKNPSGLSILGASNRCNRPDIPTLRRSLVDSAGTGNNPNILSLSSASPGPGANSVTGINPVAEEQLRASSKVSLKSIGGASKGGEETNAALLDSDVISLDKFKLHQVVRNLVSNAIKFSPRGGTVTVYAYFEAIPTPSPMAAPTAAAGVGAGAGVSTPISPRKGSVMSLPMSIPMSIPRVRELGNRISSFRKTLVGGFRRTSLANTAIAPTPRLPNMVTPRPNMVNPRQGNSRTNQVPANAVSLDQSSQHTMTNRKNRPSDNSNAPHLNNNQNSYRSFLRNSIRRIRQKSSNPPEEETGPSSTYGKLVVVVIDDGPGISAENQKRLFKEVIQFNPEKLQAGGGSGFGLFITKSIVDLHEGTVGVYSAGEGKGTRFTVELPMSRINQLPPNPSSVDVAGEGADVHDNIAFIGPTYSHRETPSYHRRPFQASHPSSTVHGIPLLSLPTSAPNQLTSALLAPALSIPTRSDSIPSSPTNRVPLKHPHDPQDTAMNGGNQKDVVHDISLKSSFRRLSNASISSRRRMSSLMLREIAKEDQSHRQSVSVIHTSVQEGSQGSQAGGGGVGERTFTRSSVGKSHSVGRSLSRGRMPSSAEGPREEDENRESIALSLPQSSPRESDKERQGETGEKVGHVMERKEDSHGEVGGGNGAGRIGDKVAGQSHGSADMIVQNEKTNEKTTFSSSIEPIWEILVVDDSPLNRKMLMKTLRAVGHVVEEANDGQIGVDMVQNRIDKKMKPYDVILMDFVMPRMDGPTATTTLRGRGYTGKIIGLTGNAMPADINHFMTHGASAVLIKPIDLPLFEVTMKELIAGTK